MARSAGAAWGVLGAYAATHAAVDAACAVLLWTAYQDGRLGAAAAWSAFVVYNLLAFALQPLVGLAADRLRAGRGAAVAGAVLTAAALPLSLTGGGLWAAVLAAGLGNAVFHVGGGVVSLRSDPGRATPVGVFVAPGAAGLAAGIVAGKAGVSVWPFAAALLVLGLALALLPAPRFDAPGTAAKPRRAASGSLSHAGAGVLALLLAVIAVRSYVGMSLAMPWKSDLALLAALTAGVVLGKAAGGFLGDRYGWRAVGVAALVLPLPLLALGATSPAAGIAGVFVFNMTMPLTLAGVAAVLPKGREGFAFGLTCLALFAGAAPALAGVAPAPSPAVLAALVLPCAAALWFAFADHRPRKERAGTVGAIVQRGTS